MGVEKTATPTMLLTVEEAAIELRIARRRMFGLITSGAVPSLKIGKSRRVRRPDLEAYIAAQIAEADQAEGAA